MIRDMQLAGLVEGTRREYLRAVRQLTAYYMISPDQLSERNVEDYILYVRDELGVAKGTFAECSSGSSSSTSIRSATTGLCSPKKSPQATPAAVARCPQRRGLSSPDRHTGKAHLSRLFHAHLRLWLAHHRGGYAAYLRSRLEADGSAHPR